MAANTYTLLKAVQIVGFRVGDLKDYIEDLDSKDPAVTNLIESINATIRKIASVRDLPVLSGSHYFTTTAPYTTGTVSTTLGSTTITGSGTTWDANMVGQLFSADSLSVAVRIESFVSTTALVLESGWPDAAVTGDTYEIAYDRYAMPANLSNITTASMDGATRRMLNLRMPSEMDRQRYSMRTGTGTGGAPKDITLFDKDASNNYWAELDPPPDAEYAIILRIAEAATTLTAAADLIPIDDENIDLVLDGATAKWKDKDVPGSFQNWINNDLKFYMLFDRKSTDENPRIVPDDVTRVQRIPGASGVLDTGQF